MEVEVGNSITTVPYLMILVDLHLSFVQFGYHDVVTEVVRQVPVPRLPHLRHEGLQQRDRDLGGEHQDRHDPTDTHLGRNVNEPLVEEEADAAVEHVGDVLEDGLVPPRGGLLQEEGPQPGHGLSRDSNQDENT